MSIEKACSIANQDFKKSASSRTLFPYIDLDERSISSTNLEKSVQHLHQLILGDTASTQSADIQDAIALFQQIWAERQTPAQKTTQCELNSSNDPYYVGRAITIVMMYMIRDPRFISE